MVSNNVRPQLMRQQLPLLVHKEKLQHVAISPTIIEVDVASRSDKVENERDVDAWHLAERCWARFNLMGKLFSVGPINMPRGPNYEYEKVVNELDLLLKD